MKRWKSRAPKTKRIEGLDVALKALLYPPAIVAGVILGKKILKKKPKQPTQGR